MTHPALRNSSILVLTLAASACFPSDKVADTAGSASGSASANLSFEGIGSADALSPTTVAVSWSDATELDGTGALGMRYEIYQGFDTASVQTGDPVYTTDPGVTSFVASDLPPDTTISYRIVPINAEGLPGSSTTVASAHTPPAYVAGTLDYATDIEPIWQLQAPLQGQTCVGCHDASKAYLPKKLSLAAWEHVMIGLGVDASTATSFVVPYHNEATWDSLVEGMIDYARWHFDYFTDPIALVSQRHTLNAWALEGALELPDAFPPVFEFSDIHNAGKYHAQWLDHDTVEVTWFHADDPESLPFNGSTLGQLTYQVYAGTDGNNIDWVTPVAEATSTAYSIQNPTMTTTFDWFGGDELTIVIRAKDAAGRAIIDEVAGTVTADPEAGNQAVNEKEILIRR